ncbi:MAG: hypothetical protein ACLP5H_22020 [Desulfomonilaceae bacterium]
MMDETFSTLELAGHGVHCSQILLFVGLGAILDAVCRARIESEVLREAIHDGSLSVSSVAVATDRRVAMETSKRSIHGRRSAASKTTRL